MKTIYLLLILLVVFILKKDYTSKLESIYLKRTFTQVPGNKLQGIDMVYVISMPSRLEYITQQINQLKLECTYLQAVTINDISEDDFRYLSHFPLKVRLCVLLSFTMCYLDALKKGYSTIIVFEDDIVTKVPIDVVQSGISEFVKSDIDFFYMGYCFMNCKQHLDKGKYQHMIHLEEDPSILCGHATAIKTRALPGIIRYSFPMTKPSDEMFMDYFTQKRSKVAIPKVPYFDQVPRDQMQSLNESYIKLEYCR
jgi:hypothetical protein